MEKWTLFSSAEPKEEKKNKQKNNGHLKNIKNTLLVNFQFQMSRLWYIVHHYYYHHLASMCNIYQKSVIQVNNKYHNLTRKSCVQLTNVVLYRFERPNIQCGSILNETKHVNIIIVVQCFET